MRGDLEAAAVYNGRMDDASPGHWSPADHPYAIAVSEAQWWLSAVRLAEARLRDPDDPRAAPVSSRQVDARNLVLALTQLLVAERLEQTALADLGINATVAERLADARSRFEAALPGLQTTRNALTHFDEWARGSGHGPQKSDISAGASRRQAARTYWGFGYDPTTHAVGIEPYRFGVETAVRAAHDLAHAIYDAAHEVDRYGMSTTSAPPAATPSTIATPPDLEA